MPLTRTTLIRLIKILAALVVVSIIVSYAIWRSLNYARGPHIDIFEPQDGSKIMTTTSTIRGKALRINNITLNGNPISIDESGNFGETIIVFPGINRLTLSGFDQFGRETLHSLTLLGTVPFPIQKAIQTPPSNATSTIATSTPKTTSTTTQQ